MFLQDFCEAQQTESFEALESPPFSSLFVLGPKRNASRQARMSARAREGFLLYWTTCSITSVDPVSSLKTFSENHFEF